MFSVIKYSILVLYYNLGVLIKVPMIKFIMCEVAVKVPPSICQIWIAYVYGFKECQSP